MKNLEKEFEINYVFKRTFCNISRSHAHTGETNAKASEIDADCACCICCPKSPRNVYRIKCCLRRRYQLMNNKHSTAYSAGQTFNYKNVAACNKFCLPLSRLGPMNMPGRLTASLTVCLPPKKRKTKIKVQKQQQKDQRVAEEERTAQFATLLGRPSLFCFGAKKCALQKVARSSLSLCWWCWVLALHKYVFIYKL